MLAARLSRPMARVAPRSVRFQHVSIHNLPPPSRPLPQPSFDQIHLVVMNTGANQCGLVIRRYWHGAARA